MIDLFISIFGQYEPLSDQYGVPYEGIASIDFTYIGTVVLYLFFVVFVLRIMMIFFKGVLNVK